ncbi:MAG: polyprenyl synthetase family protein [Kutzneria sp.]|nr:polyprenyl synthetase family protein [Kutzneria sp.]
MSGDVSQKTERSAAQRDIQSHVRMLRADLERRWSSASGRVHEISRYALLPAGKLLRPLLLLESARAVGGASPAVVSAALGVEYLHVGSLVHDDVIDNDELRRGRPSVLARNGVADAIVTGDALLLTMFVALTECVDHGVPAAAVLEAVRVLAEAGVDLCRGQAMESDMVGNLDCGLDRYLTMIGLKTGALFRGACHSGALLGGGSPAQVQLMARFGEHLGLAFQIHDDLLSYIADSEVLGKPTASDVTNRRPTYPVLIAYQVAGPADRARLELALSGQLSETDAYGLMKELLDTTGALALTRERAAHEVRLATGCLADLPGEDGVAVLAAIAESSINRER